MNELFTQLGVAVETSPALTEQLPLVTSNFFGAAVTVIALVAGVRELILLARDIRQSSGRVPRGDGT